MLTAGFLLAAYGMSFGGAALTCLIGAWWAARIEVDSVRQGLVGLLVLSSGWSIFTLAYFVGPRLGAASSGQAWFYDLGLICGFAAVLAWLYLCFALAGRGVHRSKSGQAFGLGLFTLITATKLTNPVHGLYYTATAAAKPFPHAAIDHHSLFWASLGLSYALAAIGYFVLYEFLSRTRGGTGPLAVLSGLMGLPVLLNVIGYASPSLLDVNHEPLGVAAFAVGALFVYRNRLQEVSLVSSHDGPALAVGADGRIRGFNEAAANVFPILTDTEPQEATLEDAIPELTDTSEDWVSKNRVSENGMSKDGASEYGALKTGELLTVGDGPHRRHFRIGISSMDSVGTGGALIQLSEVTERHQRRRLEKARREAVAESLPGVEFQYRAAPGERPAYRHVGDRAEEILGISPKLEGFEKRFLARVPEEYRSQYWTCTEGGAVEGQTSRVELPFNRPDGTQIWLLLASQAQREQSPEKGEELILSGIMLDITERKQARAQADLQTKVLRKVAMGDPLEETLTALVEGLEELCPGMIGSVLLCNPAEETLHHGAAPSLPSEYVRAVDGLPIGPGQGTCGTAAHSGSMTVTEDIETDPRWESYRELALRHKLRAVWSAPILGSEEEVLGTFAMYYQEPKSPSRSDQALIEEAKSLARIAIEERRKERALREQEAQLRSITDNVSDAIYRSTEEEGIIYANQTFLDLFGYESQEELSNVAPRAFYDDPEIRAELHRKEQAEGKLSGEEVRFQRKDGSVFIGLLSTKRTESHEGDATYYDGVITDITERKRQEQALQKRREKIEALYKATRRLIQAESREEVSSEAHAVLREVFSYPFGHTALVEGTTIVPQKTTSVGDYDLPQPKPLPVDSDTIAARTLQAGEPVIISDTQELENDLGYGDLRSAAGVPIGEHGALIVGNAEASRFKQSDLRLLELLAGYMALVLDRLGRESDLQAAKEEAEEAAQLKSAMMANMSHEVRTPLTSIIGFTEMLKDELEGRHQVFAEKSYRGSQRLMQTLDSILELSRLEAGEHSLDQEPFDLRGLVEKAPELVGASGRQNLPSLEVETPDHKVQLHGSRSALRRVLENLVSNALKFTPEAGRVTVRARSEDKRVALEVEDTGIGMKPAEVDKLFEAFKQASEGLGREYEGSGLGLSIVKRLVELHDGTIDVETQKGEGSRFTVWLPRQEGLMDER